MVLFRSESYGEDVAGLFAPAGGGKRPMPLVRDARAAGAGDAWRTGLFSDSRAPQAAMAGLCLYFGRWDAAHAAADAVNDRDGYFWHGIVHRQESDAFNAAYWFRKASPHPVYPLLRAEAAKAGYATRAEWDPFAFIDFCEAARRRPGSGEELLALEVQLAEWQLLFDYCAQRRTC